jgi:methylenetetrahydrofolate dehydrogenase (NADP+)/methenyltetrahydrofolate cyclohydrolase
MKFFDGFAEAQKLDEVIAKRVGELGSEVGELAIVIVGDNSSSQKYVSLKKKLCESMDIPVEVYTFTKGEAEENQGMLENKIKEICQDEGVKGVIIQLPLPNDNLMTLLDLIPKEKDVDCLSTFVSDSYYSGNFSKLSPVVRAFKHFLLTERIDIGREYTTVIGKGNLVGKPIGSYLEHEKAYVNYLNDYTTGSAVNTDLLVLSAGIPSLVKGEDVSIGCHVVDFGSTVVDGKTVGDLDLFSNISNLGTVSPSPGGMGPLVVRFLLMNFLGI